MSSKAETTELRFSFVLETPAAEPEEARRNFCHRKTGLVKLLLGEFSKEKLALKLLGKWLF